MHPITKLALTCLPSLLAQADVLFQDNFNAYSDGNLAGQGTWGQRSGGSPSVLVSSGAVSLANTGQDVVAPLTGTTYTFNPGNIPPLADPFTFYLAADVTVSAASFNPGGDYILHTSDTAGSQFAAGRLYIRRANDGGFNFGTSVSTAGPVYAPDQFFFTNPYRVIVRYDVVPGASNDIASLFAFPAGSVPATEPAAPLVIAFQSVNGPDAFGLGGVNLRQGDIGRAPTAGVDNLILATTYLEATGAPRPPLTWNPVTNNIFSPSSTDNWLRGSTPATFSNGDDVAFTDTGLALNAVVQIDPITVAGLITVNTTSGSYSLVSGFVEGRTLRATGLDLLGASQLNTTDLDIVLNYTTASPIATLIAYLNAGQLVPYAADFVSGLPTTLAIAEAADLGLTTFNRIAVDDTTVIAKYTYVGDANLDGQVDALDYERIDLAIGNTNVLGTAQGDLNYDGTVDALDYEQVDLNIGNGVGSPLGTLEGARFIPEPASLSLLALASLGLRRRRA